MGVILISHVNGDSDLIEAWVRYYVLLGIERFHLIVHGSQEENSKLFEIKNSYPITIEDRYTGTFHIDEKKRRLDAVLAQFTGQWVMLLDSDEFVEFPYANIAETIRQLEFESANLMAAPMVQHITADDRWNRRLRSTIRFRDFHFVLWTSIEGWASRETSLSFLFSTVQLTRASQREGITIRLVAGSHALPF